MKRKLAFLLTVFIISGVGLFGQSITLNTAKEIAEKHLLVVGNKLLKSASPNQKKFHFYSSTLKLENKDTLYFVLNDTLNNAFVIVAADKRVWPILGYSTEGNYSDKNQPASFISWMENRRQEIAYIKKNNLQADSKTTQQWNNLSSTNYSEMATTVGPLLQTTWNQSQYYNDKCPADVDSPYGYNGHVPTGCVATAMAQLMKYWNYPESGTSSHSYIHPTYGSQSANFGSTTYQWVQMPNKLSSPNDAVATLMYHCGVSVNMDYAPDGSGASQPRNAFVNYFKYSSNARYVEKDNYSHNEWINLLKNELNSQRPIWYNGFNYNYTSGHAFVCDGYQNSDYFHINWGWGGYEDGYFYLGSLNPDSENFTSHQGAIIKIFPNIVPDAPGEITGISAVCKGQTSVNYSVTAIPNAGTYTWTLPVGAIGTSTTNSINVTFGTNAQSGTIKVKAQNSAGVSPESSLAINVNPAPGAAGIISGNRMVCAGVSETYSISPVSGATGYLWELPTGWTGSSTSSSITVITGNNSGTISVKPTNSFCSGTSGTLNVTSNVPVSPTSATASKTTIIAGESTILNVNGGALNSALYWIWYTGNCGATQVGTGVTLSVSPTTTTTYYVQASGCGSSTICKSVTINVCSAPPSPISSSASIGFPANGLKHYVSFAVDEVPEADGYSWDYSWDGINWQINWHQNNWTSLSWLLNDQPNVPVYFRVRAYKCEPKQFSNYTYSSPQPIYSACDDPVAPTISQATNNSLSITINSETPVANPVYTSYSIYCSTTDNYIQADGTLGNTEVFQKKSEWGIKTITGLLPDKQYCFYAKARNNDGDVRFDPLNSACGTTLKISLSAMFSASDTTGCNPLTVYFTDESIGTPTSWAWDIDNNGTVDYTTKLPIHTYHSAGIYSVKLTVTNGSASDSKTLTNYITVNSTLSPTVSISAFPSNTIEAGQLVTFTANPTNGGTNPTYQWKVDGVISGNNSPTFSSSGLTNGQVVTCLLTSDLPCASPKSVTSNSISIAVNISCIAPEIVLQPLNQILTSGSKATFSVSANGTAPFLYFWYKNNVLIPDAVSASYTTPNLTERDNGNYYYCLVTNCNSAYQARSRNATVTINSTLVPSLIVTDPTTPIGKTFIVGLKFNVPVKNVMEGIAIYGGYLESFSGSSSGDTYSLTITTEEQTFVSIILSEIITDQSPYANKFAGQTLTYTTGDFTSSLEPVITKAFSFKVYPNPTTGIINIQGLSENKKTKIEVFTADGKLVMRKIAYVDEDKINLSKQEAGTYFLIINKQSIKIIKE